MHIPSSININPKYLKFWQHFRELFGSNRLAHALLLRSSPINNIAKLYSQMIESILCAKANNPCGACKNCLLIKQDLHPDLYQIKPEKEGAIIKVEQIRDLHNHLYTSPQISENKVILILNAERMNHAAANSLLKILEEPPNGVYFMLTIESISSLPATILSRCQHWYFPDINPEGDYFARSNESDLENAQDALLNQKEIFVNDLIDIRKKKVSINAVAEKWAIYALSDLSRMLYLITAQMIHNYFDMNAPKSALALKLNELMQGIKITVLFSIMDKLNQLSKNLSYSINVNQLLTIEDLLLSFL